jgi:hypothetical protein
MFAAEPRRLRHHRQRLQQRTILGAVNGIPEYQSAYVMREEDYPYTGVPGPCKYDPSKGVFILT